jgi:hypothetical protein
MCGICKGEYFFCSACDDTVNYTKINGEIINDLKKCKMEFAEIDDEQCDSTICNDCYTKGIKYCKFCVEKDLILDKLLERAKINIDKLIIDIEIHKIYKT